MLITRKTKTFAAILMAATALSVAETAAQTTPPATATKSENVYTFTEHMPEFKGGSEAMFQFLNSNIRFPNSEKEGKVYISFVVDTDGSVQDVKVLRGISEEHDQEAIRIVKLMDKYWEPGSQSGKPVKVRYNLPIHFRNPANKVNASADKLSPINKPSELKDQLPAYKGGTETLNTLLAKHLQLPEEEKIEHLHAKVTVKFMVETDGSISNIQLEQTKLKKTVGPGSDFDYMDPTKLGLQNKAVLAQLAEAATAAIKATNGNWEPAIRNGKKERMEVVLPINFSGTDLPAIDSQQPLISIKLKEPFSGGKSEMLKFITKEIRYPDTDAEGKITILFLTDKEGKIKTCVIDPNMKTKPDPFLQQEVERLVEKMKGSIYREGNVNMPALYRIVLNFTIKDNYENGIEPTKADVSIVKLK